MPTMRDMTARQVAAAVDRDRDAAWERLNAESDAYEAARDYLEQHPEEWEACETCEFQHVGPGLVFRVDPCEGCVEAVLEGWQQDAEDRRAEAHFTD